MAVDSGISVSPLHHPKPVLIILLIAVSLNLFYPGEVFFQSRYFLVLASVSACAIVLYRDHKDGRVSAILLRRLALAFLPLAGTIPSLIWTTNQDRSQEVFLLMFSYSCLLFSVWRYKLGSGSVFASLSILVAAAIAVEAHALYQHFAGLEALKAELVQNARMEGSFKEALLARVQSGRVFANFSLPNTLAGLVAMILPIQIGLLGVSLFPSKPRVRATTWIAVLTRPWTQAALIASIVHSIWVMTLTQSFGGWVGFTCSLGAMALVGFSKANRRILRVGGLCLLLLLASAWLAWISHKRGFVLWNLSAPENPISLRIIAYRTALAIFHDFPVVGVGLGNYGTLNPHYQTSPRFVTQFAHNTMLQMLSEAGLILVAGLLFTAAAGLRAKSPPNRVRTQTICGDPLYLGIVGSLVAWLVHNALDVDLYFPSLGSLGFLVLGLFLNYGGLEEHETTELSWVAKWSIAAAGIVLGLALFTGIRFHLSRSFLDLAETSATSGSPAEACRYARWAVNLRPGDAAGIVFLGKLETEQLRRNKAEVPALLQRLGQSLRQAVHLDPYNAEFHFQLSRVYKGLGEEGLSASSLERAAMLFPSEPRYRSAAATPR